MIRLKFPGTNGGQEDGFNNPGAETFTRTLESMAREVVQNSLDARSVSNRPVRVDFNVKVVLRTEIPCIDAMVGTLQNCKKAESAEGDKAKTFFEEGLVVAADDLYITMLEVADYETTGLTGSCTDKHGKWFTLVRAVGISSKSGAGLGSFGIGKWAPFAVSKLRTVLYSTMTPDGHAFQGVMRLISHECEGETTQGTGYIGEYDKNRFTAVRKEEDIPMLFRRSKVGTSLFILGFDAGEDDWQRALERQILLNFWPAILDNALEVGIGPNVITRANLEDKLKQYDAEYKEEFLGYQYYLAFKKGRRFCSDTETPGMILTTDFWQRNNGLLCLQMRDGPSAQGRIAFIRNGMLIEEHAYRAGFNYVGCFQCETEEGNTYLRSLEPPAHNEWDKELCHVKSMRKHIGELHAWMRACISRLSPDDSSTSSHIVGLEKLLPSIGQSDAPEPGITFMLLKQPELAVGTKANYPTLYSRTPTVTGGGTGSSSGKSGKGVSRPKPGDRPAKPTIESYRFISKDSLNYVLILYGQYAGNARIGPMTDDRAIDRAFPLKLDDVAGAIWIDDGIIRINLDGRLEVRFKLNGPRLTLGVEPERD